MPVARKNKSAVLKPTPSKKTKPKVSKKKIEKVIEEALPVLLKTNIKWEDAYPCIEEVYKIGKETITVLKYHSTSDDTFEEFLFEVIRSNSFPKFIKINFTKLKKLIEKEISHRDKIYLKLSREQVIAFQSYFRDDEYFERDDNSEYFQHELEKVYFNYLKSYLETGIYESRARSHNRKRRQILTKNGIL